MHTYIGVLRYSSFVDISRIFVSLTLSYGLIITMDILYPSFVILPSFPVSIILMTYIINLSLMVSSRVLAKLLYELLMFDRAHSKNVFIYGTKEAGVNIAKSLRVNRNNHYRLCGFISDDKELIGKEMMGCKVYENNERLFNILSVKDVQTIIISPTKMEMLSSTDLLDQLLVHNIKLLSVPPLNEWQNSITTSLEFRQIQIEDLLERTPIQVDIHKIASHIEGKRIMITGAAGSIGSEIVRQVAALNPYQLILIDQAETPLHDIRLELQEQWREVNAKTIIADVGNLARMEEIFRQYAPQYVFHAAAYKHVPMMEDNVSESIQTNVLGTKNMADLSLKYRTEKFVLVSTDKAVNPTNVMGCSKRIAEIYIQSLAKKLKDGGDRSVKFITTRFGNVLGSNGSVIPRFKEQIQRGGPVTVTHPDIIRYFMTIPEACRLVLEAGSMGNGGEIYIFDMGKPVKILDLAKRMIFLSGHYNIKIEFTGLRHGEKLYEELLNVKECTKPTHHEKIMIARVREYKYEEARAQIQQLIKISYGYEPMQIVAMMKEIVPEFVSKNSEFEILDKKTIERHEKVI
ncbi:MAG: nucleoside-diphosphate sugar epimerase/dehydratase [Bacteroides sp.]